MARKKPDTPEFALFPRVVPDDWDGTLEVAGEYGHTRFDPSSRYSYELLSLHWQAGSERRKTPISGSVEADDNGVLNIPFKPDITGEWVLTLDSENSKNRHLPANQGVYVRPREDYHLRPYIGDLHAHSTGSDGRQEPAYCAIRAMDYGLDFYALTDHRNFGAAERMIDDVKYLIGPRMLLIKGEEMHPEPRDMSQDPFQYHRYHFVAAGHDRSIRDLFLCDEEASRREVLAIVEELKARETVPGLDVEAYAESLWKTRRARQLGALVLFCHPYWDWSLNLDESAREQTFADREFDAVEVVTDADPSSLMLNRIARPRSTGGPLNVVGVSDSHRCGPGTELQYATFVLAENLTLVAVLEAVRTGRSLAYRAGPTPLFVGPDDMVDFAEFYFLHLLPLKRRVMSLEAALAFSGLRGGAFDRGLVEQLDGELVALDRKLWV